MDEKNLIESLRQLDKGALETAFEQYAPILFKYALRLCHDANEADDVVGEAFSRLLLQLNAGKGPQDNLRSYLYQTAYHIIVDRAREQKHYTPFEVVSNQPKDESQPPELAEENRILGLIFVAIYKVLTDDQRHVIILRFLEGFDLKETAEIMEKEVNNIKVIQNRALGRLREALKDEIEDN